MEQAAEWFVELASGEATEADRQRWQAWRSAHPDHEPVSYTHLTLPTIYSV